MRVKLAMLAAVVALVPAAVPASGGAEAAAPYINKPGISSSFSADGTRLLVKAPVWCGKWKGITQLLLGTQGFRLKAKTKYICQRAKSTTVNFVVGLRDLEGIKGRWQYTLRVGRHDANGDPTRWTDSQKAYFTYS